MLNLRKIGSLVLVVAVLATLPPLQIARAENAMPLFDLFKAVCIDTRQAPVEVERAAKTAGGEAGPAVDRSKPVRYLSRSWSIRRGEDTFAVSLTHIDEPANPAVATVCSVKSAGLHRASLEAARQWAGVPAKPSSNDKTSNFVFAERDAVHVAVDPDEAWFRANPGWQTWSFAVQDGPSNVLLIVRTAEQRT